MKIPQHKLLEYSQSVNLNINLQVELYSSQVILGQILYKKGVRITDMPKTILVYTYIIIKSVFFCVKSI